jgi:phosphopantetheinyl transferase
LRNSRSSRQLAATRDEPRAVASAWIDVWTAHVGDGPDASRQAWEILSREERETATRFARRRHRGAFVARRAFVRFVLARYTGVPPRLLRFARTPNGKPALADRRAVEFSASSSDGIVVCAVGRRPLGIDVERIRDDLDWRAIARRFFSEAERSSIERGGFPRFFEAWTTREAIIKARGDTLAHLRRAVADAHGACPDGIHARTLDVGSGFAAALASHVRSPAIRMVACTARSLGSSSA